MKNQNSTKTTTYGPYSPIKCAGNMFFVSGQVGIDPISKTTKIGIKDQTKQVVTNLSDVLKLEGLKLDNVVQTTVYLTDMSDFEEMNKVYNKFFNNIKPARATVAVKELPRVGQGVPIVVEIEAVAIKGDNDE